MNLLDAKVTTARAAQILDVTAQTVRNLIHSGALKAIPVDNGYKGRFMIDLADVEALKEERSK